MNKLLSTLSQKWPEYLLEILVLIIGIYGAFMLDNWNERRKEGSEAQDMMQQIRSNLQEDQLSIKRGIEELQLLDSAYTIALRRETTDTTMLQFAALTVMYSAEVDFDQSAFEQFRSSNKLRLLNDSLVISIQKLYLDYSKNEENRAYYHQVVEQEIRPLYVKVCFNHDPASTITIKKDGSIEITNADIQRFLNHPYLREPLILQKYTCLQISNDYRNHLIKIDEILKMIDSQIK